MLSVTHPLFSRDTVEQLLDFRYGKTLEPMEVVFVLLRGANGSNKRGVYDDSLFILGPYEFIGFAANADPHVYRKNIATLKEGVWEYETGIHGLSRTADRRSPAFIQAGKVIVQRDLFVNGKLSGYAEDKGWFGINIHRGGNYTTGSLGCVTLPPSQWDSFYNSGVFLMGRYGQKIVNLCVLDYERTVQLLNQSQK